MRGLGHRCVTPLLPTRTSLDVLLPFLRAGGHDVIQHRAWAHHAGAMWQEYGGVMRDQPGLVNVLVQLTRRAGSRPEVVTELRIDDDVVEVGLYRSRGNRFRPLR